ncbi:DEAD/DEAH box helicase family protein [Sporosarcina sp. Sa3CUA8]|uniref:DEAD/DEAH box helicase family protein n=2 Tax=Sporosarcina gallistercoris TaxID=2762245 RepID=A0ABR8PK49_9BACL|nr:DEAD/DEAH box helicase family protein [Sporosarcina gallistercoris]
MNDIRLITHDLLHHIKGLADSADTIYIVTAFLMNSGVKEILSVLQQAALRKADIKILTGDYMSITQPDALLLLHRQLADAEIRMMESGGTSFHPKAYLFGSKTGDSVIVGSSNLSKSALGNGVEWNLHTPSSVDPMLFETAAAEFMKLFLSPATQEVNEEQILQYRERYERMNTRLPFSREWAKQEELEMTFGPSEEPTVVLERQETYEPVILTPRPAQKLALRSLDNTLLEERDKALVVLATGLGKTYLAAFFAQKFQRILFIAHREELLTQAMTSFRQVNPQRSCGLFNGFSKDIISDVVFASIQTLSMQRHLNTFERHDFDLIIVDECHHAMANSYERVLAHFSPKFLLGLTATPERLDNKDVYSLCDGNIAISVNFFEAIRNNWLSPFVYYGVFDKTDYSELKFRNNRYDEEGLLQLQIRTEYAEAVYDAWVERKQTRTIGFCSSVRQAQFLSKYFSQQGARSIALHGGSDRTIRMNARQQLQDGSLDILFTVDLFNEGVDIPAVDTLLFVRPTESPTVFTQQIGRGLRLANGKSHCVIIDLIGNYQTARRKFSVFIENDTIGNTTITGDVLTQPEQWEFNLETAVIDLLEAMKPKMSPKQALVHAYQELKLTLGRRPTYLEFHLKADADIEDVKRNFKAYPIFLKHADALTDLEVAVLETYKEWFVNVATTSMTKSYKMVLLHVMLKRGSLDWYKPITATEAAPGFHQYLTEKSYRLKDWHTKKGATLINYDENRMTKLIEDMPMTKWSGSYRGLITFVNRLFTIQIDPEEMHAEILFDWTRQICEGSLHMYFERKSK